MDPKDLIDKMKIRDITEDDIDEVYQFIIKEQGTAVHDSVRRYIEDLIENGELKIDGKISLPKHEERLSRLLGPTSIDRSA